jgi:hypothetical protein
MMAAERVLGMGKKGEERKNNCRVKKDYILFCETGGFCPYLRDRFKFCVNSKI